MTQIKQPSAPRPPVCICGSIIRWIFGIVSPTLLHTAQDEKAKIYRQKLAQYEDELIDYKIETRKATRRDWDYKRYKLYIEKQNRPIVYHGETIGEMAHAGLVEGILAGASIKDEDS